jgi:hypothetical protein
VQYDFFDEFAKKANTIIYASWQFLKSKKAQVFLYTWAFKIGVLRV